MRKRIVAVFMCAVIVVAFGAYLIQPTRNPSNPMIGTFYYTWYNPDSSVSWDTAKIVDKPVLGYYNSCDPTIIKQHLNWMQNVGIDFVITSWWGFYDDYGTFTDTATKQVFETAQNINSTLKFAVMVEPFHVNSSSYNYAEIYNHIYDNFVAPYSSLYYKDSKPVICFFNNQSLTDNGNIPKDERFNTVLVGQQSYTQWIYTNLNRYDYRACGDYQTSVTPRYDESHLNRTRNLMIDIYLNESTYDTEWENAIQLWKDGKINTILISTWNEFPERTAIEPHIDATASNQSTHFLYDKTKYYINQIQQSTSMLPAYLLAGLTAVLLVSAITINQFYVKPRKRQILK